MIKKWAINCENIVLFLGNARAGEYEWFCENDIKIGIILDVNNSKNVADLEKFECVIYFDFRKQRYDELYYLYEQLMSRYKVLCLLNMREFYVRHHVLLCEKYSISGLPLFAAENSLSKYKMRNRFAEKIGNDASARYRIVKSLDDLYDFFDAVGGPIILKPVDLYASLFVELISERKQLQNVYERVGNLFVKYTKKINRDVGIEGAFIVEEYLVGKTHSIDCLVDKNGIVYPTPIVDGFTANDYGFEDFNRCAAMLPSDLTNEMQDQVRCVAAKAIRSLGICSALTHVELVYTKTGPRLLEVGARIGGSRGQMLRKAYGIEIVAAYAKMLQGDCFDEELAIKYKHSCGFVRPLPYHKGLFRKVNDLESIGQMSSYSGHHLSALSGMEVGPSKEGYMHFFTINMFNESAEQLWADMNFLLQRNNFFTIDYV